jgi:ribosomal protein S18 acetylase RimI-like enzyme
MTEWRTGTGMRSEKHESKDAEPMQVRRALPSDVSGMARCHMAAFRGQFMAEMGPTWLAGLFRYFIDDEGGVSLVATDGTNEVLGFAVGGKPDIRERFLRRAMWRYVHVLLWKFLTNRVVRRRLLAEFLGKLGVGRGHTDAHDLTKGRIRRNENRALLLVITVRSEMQGTGLASKLIKAFEQGAAEAGFTYLYLTVLTENARGIAFYKKCGWQPIGQFGTSSRFELRPTNA